jgi:hypothetical protein
MQLAPRIYVPVLALVGLLFVLARVTAPGAERTVAAGDVAGARYRLDAAAAKRSGALLLPTAARQATFHFDRAVAPSDRQLFLAAVAAARPEARQLIGLVDGLVDVHVGPTGVPGAIGLTRDTASGYDVTVDLGLVAQRFGQRGITRTVLHELGHVVDHALVTDDVVASMDAEIPAGLGCDQGVTGACAGRQERFAETFAKWALGDIGINLDLGYKIPPPSVSLDVWGAPLARLAANSDT